MLPRTDDVRSFEPGGTVLVSETETKPVANSLLSRQDSRQTTSSQGGCNAAHYGLEHGQINRIELALYTRQPYFWEFLDH